MTKKQQLDTLEKYRSEVEEALNQSILDTMKQAALPNSMAWLGVVLGAFALNLLLLVAVSGG